MSDFRRGHNLAKKGLASTTTSQRSRHLHQYKTRNHLQKQPTFKIRPVTKKLWIRETGEMMTKNDSILDTIGIQALILL